MEGDLVRRESTLPFWQVDAAAVRDRGRLTLVANVWRLLRGVGQALQLIWRERPAAIFGTGGYVCVPLFVAAWLMRVPSAIYLPDVVPGLAVRLLSRIATVTLASIPDAAAHVGLPVATLATWQPSRTALVVTGYPVRADIQQGARETTRAMLASTMTRHYCSSMGAAAERGVLTLRWLHDSTIFCPMQPCCTSVAVKVTKHHYAPWLPPCHLRSRHAIISTPIWPWMVR